MLEVVSPEESAGTSPPALLVRVSSLVDFPCQVLEGEESFLQAVTSLSRGLEDWSCRIEMEEGLREFLFEGLGGGVGVDSWDAFISSTQDHLCMARLCWFLKREGMVTFV